MIAGLLRALASGTARVAGTAAKGALKAAKSVARAPASIAKKLNSSQGVGKSLGKSSPGKIPTKVALPKGNASPSGATRGMNSPSPAASGLTQTPNTPRPRTAPTSRPTATSSPNSPTQTPNAKNRPAKNLQEMKKQNRQTKDKQKSSSQFFPNYYPVNAYSPAADLNKRRLDSLVSSDIQTPSSGGTRYPSGNLHMSTSPQLPEPHITQSPTRKQRVIERETYTPFTP